MKKKDAEVRRMTEGERIIPTMGINNCGGKCVIRVHMKDGKILRLSTETPEEAGDAVPLTACARGLQYHKTFLGEDRLLYPMRRTGKRGEGKFRRISWEEAVDTIASEWIRIRDAYGPGSRYVPYATGVSGLLSGREFAKRLLSLDGGYLGYYNSYSSACIGPVTELMYGTRQCGNPPESWADSRLIILWAHNPLETKFDAETMHALRRAKARGVPIISVDPRRNETAAALDAEWIPVRPATDSALLDAMAYVILERGLEDRAFLDRCCLGFDGAHLPAGVPESESVEAYLTGRKDGVPKTPEWASQITGVPPETIESLAVRYATAKPAALIQGYGAQRHAYGEQSARGGILLSCMTGNVGVWGGWACGAADCTRHPWPRFPSLPNPYGRKIPSFLWTDAVDRGAELTALDGVKGAERLDGGIKMILNIAGNCLINQHGNVNRTAEILRDEHKCEFIVVSDLFMTATAKFADILLPGVSMFECDNISLPWKYGEFVGFSNACVPPLGESRQEYDWLCEVADRLGLRESFSEWLSWDGWLRRQYAELRGREPELPEYDELRRTGLYRYKKGPRRVALEAECRDPAAHPFPTPSGRIELYAPEVAETRYKSFFPPIPRYVEPPEGPQDALARRWPLQLIGWHTGRRCHSVHDNNPNLVKLDPQRLWIHPQDAAARSIGEGDEVLVCNDRGRVRIPAHVTDRVMRGVVALSQGAWYRPEKDGTDAGGCINTLTSLAVTPYSRGNTQHTILVEVRPAVAEGCADVV